MTNLRQAFFASERARAEAQYKKTEEAFAARFAEIVGGMVADIRKKLAGTPEKSDTMVGGLSDSEIGWYLPEIKDNLFVTPQRYFSPSSRNNESITFDEKRYFHDAEKGPVEVSEAIRGFPGYKAVHDVCKAPDADVRVELRKVGTDRFAIVVNLAEPYGASPDMAMMQPPKPIEIPREAQALLTMGERGPKVS